MDSVELVSVLSLKDPNEAEVVKVALKGEGIECFIGGENQGGMTGIFDVEVLVKETDADRARQFIEEHLQG